MSLGCILCSQLDLKISLLKPLEFGVLVLIFVWFCCFLFESQNAVSRQLLNISNSSRSFWYLLSFLIPISLGLLFPLLILTQTYNLGFPVGLEDNLAILLRLGKLPRPYAEFTF